MTLGDLYDRLKAVDEAIEDIEQARLSLQHGGSPETIRGKREVLESREEYLRLLREEDIQ